MQKDLFFALKVAKEELEASGSVPLDMESIYKKRFHLTVSGTDKEAFVSAIEKEGLSYKNTVELLLDGVEKAKKEKSNNS
jgi:hypothetical protein